jgi:pimeloyl-ACP methyl ester carboxylesterase
MDAGDHEGAGRRVVDYEILHEPGEYSFVVAPGRYHIVAFEDLDGNLLHGHEERVGAWNEHAVLEIAGGGTTDSLDVLIAASAPEPLDDELSEGDFSHGSRGFRIGDVVPLSDPRFGREVAEVGVWEPLRFLEEHGAGLFWLEPYDPTRAVVVFVHGYSGYPQEFTALVESLDRERFQAWVVQYPSGAPLDVTAEHFARGIEAVLDVTATDRVCVVAHSMGGVVTRAAIGRYLTRHEQLPIRGLITLASPLGGHASAVLGLQRAPAIVPAWRFLVPDSPFITSLFEQPLPDGIPYSLVFTWTSAGLLGGEPSDGVVHLASQLRHEAQLEAEHIRGFETTHTGVLREPAAIAYVNERLAACAR